MNKYIITLVLISTLTAFSSVKGQNLDTKALEQIEFAKKMTYQMGAELFSKRKLHFKTNSEFIAPWDKMTKEKLEDFKAALRTIIENGTVEIKESRSFKKSLVFKSQVPEIDDLSDMLKINLVETNLMDNDKNALETRKRGSTFYGSKFNSSNKNGITTSSNQITITNSYRITSKSVTGTITGNIKLRASFPSEYKKVLITPSDIGKEFSLGTQKFQVINIVENKVFLKFLEQEAIPKFKFVNLDNNGNEIASLTYNELEKLKEDNKAIDMSTLHGMETLPEKVYAVFNKNPSITKEEFNSSIEPWLMQSYKTKGEERLQDKLFTESYIVLTSVGPIANCNLYIENHGISKEFILELK
jgi:hypothetical protein